MKSLRNAFAFCALCAAAAAQAEPAAPSFADVYRLTVAGPLAVDAAPAAQPLPEESASAGASAPAAQAPMLLRTAADEDYVFTVASARAKGEPRGAYQFSVGALPEPQRWLLLASGLALAGWVARRRLFHSL